MLSNLLVQINNGIGFITLNRPEIHNAFDAELILNLITALKKLEKNATVKILILQAIGKSFSAGADFNWMKRMANYSYQENVKDAKTLLDLMETLKYFPKPTIAKIQGSAFGGGVGLIACCDIAIASDEALFALSEVKMGLIPAVISPYVISLIGERATRRYFLTGEKMSAEEAYRVGLITLAVSPDKLDQTVQEFIEQLSQNSPAALISAKKLIDRVTFSPYDIKHKKLNVKSIAQIRVSKEGQEGLRAFLEKRKPNW